jgi:SEC-C motif
MTKLGRNDPCHCGSGRKYKHCCLLKDEAAARKAREAETGSHAPAAAETAKAPPPPPPPRQKTQQPWKRGAQNTRGFQRMNTPRKVGS